MLEQTMELGINEQRDEAIMKSNHRKCEHSLSLALFHFLNRCVSARLWFRLLNSSYVYYRVHYTLTHTHTHTGIHTLTNTSLEYTASSRMWCMYKLLSYTWMCWFPNNVKTSLSNSAYGQHITNRDLLHTPNTVPVINWMEATDNGKSQWNFIQTDL